MPIIHEDDCSKKMETSSTLKLGDRILSVKDLNFSFPDGRQVLDGVSLEMGWCEKIAIVGENGAGKSTFLQNINGLLVGHGSIEVVEMELNKNNLPKIRALVGYVFQNPDDQLFSPSVFEDVAFGPLHMGLPENEINSRVEDALSKVGMSDYGARLSHYLSVGEKKRISIATVLAMTPSLLILDEPTANLDPRARRSLIKLLDNLPISMIIATHDLEMVREFLPRTIIVHRGKFVADGNTTEIINNQELLLKYGL